MTRFITLSFATILFLSGCSNAVPIEKEAAPVVVVVDSQLAKISLLLREADAAFADNRLMTPAHDNAYARLQTVLSLDADNVSAHEGLHRILEQYLSWAIDNATRGHYSRALQYTNKAQLIDASHPNIKSVLAMIENRQSSQTTIYHLDPILVAHRNLSEETFYGIATEIEQTKAFVVISAPDDETGRWIYQQLNNLTQDRIPAQFNISDAPSVSLSTQ